MSEGTSVKKSTRVHGDGYGGPDRRNKHSDQKKMESYGIFRSIAEDSVDAIICGDHRGKIVYFNRAAEKLFGYRDEEITGRAVSNLMPARFRKAHREGLKRVVSGGKRKVVGKTVELTALRKDGVEFPVELSLSAAETREGLVFLSMVRDISERVKTEEALRKNEERLIEAQRIAHLGSWEWDMEEDVVYWSDEVYRIFGLSPAEFAADYNSFLRSVHPEDVEKVKEAISRVAQEGLPYSLEHRVVRPDGSVRHVHERGEVHFRNKQPARMTGTVLDVTEARTAEDGLRKLALQNRQLLEATGEGIYGVDAGGRLIFINPAAGDLLGYATDELLGRFSHDIWHHTRKDGAPYPADECPIVAAHARGESLSVTGEVFIRRDGTAFPVEYTVNPVMESGVVSGAVVTFSDITERKRAEEVVGRVYARNEMILNSVGEGIYGINLRGEITFINPAAAAMTGFRIKELVGKSGHRIFHHTKADGSPYPEKECPIYAAYSDGMIHRISEDIFWKRDGTSFPVEYVSTPVSENGELAGAVVAFSDITDRLEAECELRRLNRALLAISLCNEKLIRADDEERLFGDICEIIVKTGGYRFAWAGYAAVSGKVVMRPVVHAGENRGFFEKLPEIWKATEKMEGPVRKAVRSGRPALIRNLTHDRRYIPWKQEALKRGLLALAAYPIRVHGQVMGILCIFSDTAEAFDTKEAKLLAELASDLAFGIENIRNRKARDRAEEGLQESLGRLRRAVDGTTQALAVAAEARDPYIAGHQQRVAELAIAIAREMGLNGDSIDCIDVAGKLHDVGKISIPAEILTKPGRLSDLEMDMVRTHPESSYHILRQVDFPWPVAKVVRQHHERLDGTGYPMGLRGDDILPEARIIAVADVVEAMMSHRPYRPGLGPREALAEIERGRGSLFDPEAVDACLRLFAEQRFEFEKAA